MKNINPPSAKIFKYAKSLFSSSQIVAFPTETVYGLGANALDAFAVKKIFDLKGRASKNPLIVHLGYKEDIIKYGIISNQIEKKIIERLMPGPITILLRKRENIPNIVSSNPYVGIRIPSNQSALQMLQVCRLPIAAPSANISSKPSPTSAKMVYEYFGEDVPLIIDGGECHVGIESMVVKVNEHTKCAPMSDGECKKTYHIVIMRPGFITKEDIENIFKNTKNISVEYSTHLTNISPGNFYKHYSPRAQVEIIKHLDNSFLESKLFTSNGSPLHKRLGLILTQEFILEKSETLEQYKDQIKIFSRGSKKNLLTCAQKLFSIYNLCDRIDIDYILIEGLEEIGLGYSIMNRVKKSAEKKHFLPNKKSQQLS